MSINFEDDMGPEARAMLEKLFKVEAIDERTALIGKIDKPVTQKQMCDVARAAKQVAEMEINKIGDRKEVGGVIYELREAGWYRLPIGTGE